MSVIYKCDHCLKIVDTKDIRNQMISNRNYNLCDPCKYKFEKIIRKFFHIPDFKMPKFGLIDKDPKHKWEV